MNFCPLSPRQLALLEATTQSLIGLPIGYAVVYGIESLRLPHAWSATAITVAMFLISTLRSYVIRRRFQIRRGRVDVKMNSPMDSGSRSGA